MATEWYYLRDGQTIGPVSARALQAMAARRELGPKDLVTKGGADKWTTADRLKGLSFPAEVQPAGDAPAAVPEADDVAPSPRIERPEQPQAPPSVDEPSAAAPPPRRRPTMPQPDPESAIEADRAVDGEEVQAYDDPADALAAMAVGIPVGPAIEDPWEDAYREPIDLDGDGEAGEAEEER